MCWQRDRKVNGARIDHQEDKNETTCVTDAQQFDSNIVTHDAVEKGNEKFCGSRWITQFCCTWRGRKFVAVTLYRTFLRNCRTVLIRN